jgi:hypothetical protein
MTFASRPQRAAKLTSSCWPWWTSRRAASAHFLGHRAGAGEGRGGQLAAVPPRQKLKRGDLQRATPRLRSRGREGRVVVQVLVKAGQSIAKADRQSPRHLAPSGVDLGGVRDAAHRVDGLSQVVLTG